MKILVSGKLPGVAVVRLKERHQVDVDAFERPMDRRDLMEKVCDRDGLLCMITDKIDSELMEKAPNLRMIANFGVGYDNIDIDEATARGIWVSNTPGVLTDATADLTFALILASARRLVEGDKIVRAGQWTHWGPSVFLGSEVTGKTLGIIGMGTIGKAVAKRARGFDMRVVYYNRNRVPESDESALNAAYCDMDTLLSTSDFVTLHVALTPQTRQLIGQRELQLMKRSSFLINASRGPVVDETALVDALRSRKIAGAGLDVYENEPATAEGLTELDNVVLAPHIGSATIETRTRMAQLAVTNLLAGLEGEIPPNCLNCG